MGKLFQQLLKFAAKNKDVARDALVSGGLNTGLSLLSGADPGTALKYGLADVAASYPATMAVRKLRPGTTRMVQDPKTKKMVEEKVRSKLEMPANIGASVLSGIAVAGGEMPSVTPSNISQSQQIMQQNIQRDLINQGILAGRLGMPNAYFPGTMLQAQGLEGTYMRQQLEEMMQPQQYDMGNIAANMGAIVGV
jgi:hypothetical protein